MTRLLTALFLAIFLSLPAFGAKLSWVEQIPIESYGKMREVERYQMQIAEKHYLSGEYKIALDEYEKFLALYESSAGAPYAQLMWSHCQVKLRKVNTAIREGFQSVIDYWPNSQEAVLASYLIGRSFQDIGEIAKAKAAYGNLMEAHPKGPIPVLAKVNLLEMATIAKDDEERLQLLEELTYNSDRTDATRDHCANASRELSKFYFYRGDFPNGLKALATSYSEKNGQLPYYAYEYARGAVSTLNRGEDTKEQAKNLASTLIDYLEKQVPLDLAEKANRQPAWDNLSRIAAVYSTLGQGDSVLKTYERIGKMLGTDDRLLGQIASYYRSAGEREKAKQTYRRFENQVNGTKNVAYMLREERKYDEAIEMYRDLINQHPEGINDYLWAIAECYEGKSDWKNAIQTYRQVDRFPSNYFRMAICHRRLKQSKEALMLYGQAKSHESSAPEATIQIGYTYEEAGQKENAIKAFQLTCRSFPKSSQASRAHAHLQTKYDINVTLGGAKDE